MDKKAAPVDELESFANMDLFIQKCTVCTVPKAHGIREGVWWEHGVTVGHQSQI